jgi:acetyl-CoA carboxylase carboxyl transferase subunit alpha
MPPETLDFEEPIAVLMKEIEALSLMPRTDARQLEIESLKRRVESIRAELYQNLTPWQRVLVARHPNRPGLEDFIQRLFPGFIEIHGDRRFADDHAIMTGFAEYHEQAVLLVGHVKGRDTKEKIFRNFGYARPEGYRKAMRAMKLAEKFRRPIIVFVDTPAAYPGIESEERGVAEAIAVNLREMMLLDTPVIVIVSGEGGSGGALGIAIGDRVLMQEFAIYSVIPPEGCAALVWRVQHHRRDHQGAHRRRPHRPRRGRARRRRGPHTRARGGQRPRFTGPPRQALRQVPQHGPPGIRVRRATRVGDARVRRTCHANALTRRTRSRRRRARLHHITRR